MDSSLRPPTFRSTHWSAISAARDASHPESETALAELCEAYWQPLYAFLRQRGKSAQDAEDLTQGFFSQLLEKSYLDQVDPSKGRFRTFLLAALKHYLSNQQAKDQAQKRGGGQLPISLDFTTAEQGYQAVATEQWTAEALYERQWALALLNRVLDRIQLSYERDGKGDLFQWLKPALTGNALNEPYSQLASRLGSTTGAIKVAAHRLRKTYRRELREELFATLSREEEVDSEREVLLKALLGPKH